jgi:Fe-S-cluster-containing hydrogenase component 2
VLVLERQGWEKLATLIDAQACTGCSRCMPVCPFDAVSMQPGASADMLVR